MVGLSTSQAEIRRVGGDVGGTYNIALMLLFSSKPPIGNQPIHPTSLPIAMHTSSNHLGNTFAFLQSL